MAKLKKTIAIAAPVEKVFDCIGRPENMPVVWPSLLEVRDVERQPDGLYRYNWTYKMAGMRFDGHSEDLEIVPNQRIVNRNRGGIDATITWTLKSEDGGTELTYEVEYSIPIPVLGKLAEAVVVRMNENEADVLLSNIKARVEAQA